VKSLNAKSDQYSLALVAFYALTGKQAFPAESSKESLIARLTSRPQSLQKAREDVEWPEALQWIFDRALAPEPADRFESVSEFAHALSGAISDMAPSQTAEMYRRAPRRAHCQRRRAHAAQRSACVAHTERQVAARRMAADREAAAARCASNALTSSGVSERSSADRRGRDRAQARALAVRHRWCRCVVCCGDALPDTRRFSANRRQRGRRFCAGTTVAVAPPVDSPRRPRGCSAGCLNHGRSVSRFTQRDTACSDGGSAEDVGR
jgi:hypothetical protein